MCVIYGWMINQVDGTCMDWVIGEIKVGGSLRSLTVLLAKMVTSESGSST